MKTLLNIVSILSWFGGLYCASTQNIYGEVVLFTITIISVISSISLIIVEKLDKKIN